MSSAELKDAGPIVEMRNVAKHYALGGAFQFKPPVLRALSDISLSLTAGRALALVGESGSGKSTCARLIAKASLASEGDILFRGTSVASIRGASLFAYRAAVQMVFQDPFGSLNPTHTVGYHLERPLRLHGGRRSKSAVRSKIVELLESVGLSPGLEYASRRPHELSGGQRQRVAIARALSVEPSVLIADEPTSMLDASVRLDILNLLQDLKETRKLAILYITHDIATARYLAEDIAVLYSGHMVERGPSERVTEHPEHPYTKLLISSVPDPTKKIVARAGRKSADIPMWTSQSRGCPFVSRCPRASSICRDVMPDPTTASDGHFVRCHNL